MMPKLHRYGWRGRLVNAVAMLAVWLGLGLTAPTFAAETALPSKPAESVRVLAFGDSLTTGFGLRESQSFAAQLEAALRARGHKVDIINAGVSGDTSAGGRARLAWSLADKPDAAIVELGANDMLRGIDPREVYANLDDILTRLAAGKVPVLLTGMMAAPNYGSAYAKAFDAIYPRLAARHNVPLYPFFLDGVAARRDFTQEDGLHPNAQGVAEIVRRILPRVEALLPPA